MNRRGLLRSAGAVGLGLLSARALGQTAEEPVATCPPPPVSSFITSDIANNHGHLLILTKDAQPGNYTIQGRGNHSHLVAITEDVLAQLAAAGSLQVVSSSGGGHTHTVDLLFGA